MRESREGVLNTYFPVLQIARLKEWNFEVKFFSKYKIVLIGILWAIVGTPEVFAFSIGSFQVQSKFGEKFNASIEIALDYDGPVEVSLGDISEYEKLGLDRQDIIEALVIDPVVSNGGLKKTIQIRSNNPLFFPSFNLVVRATHNGGTLLESFLVTVDFQQSLALNVRQGKKNSPKLRKKASVEEPRVSQEKVLPSQDLAKAIKEVSDSPKGSNAPMGSESLSIAPLKTESPHVESPHVEPKISPKVRSFVPVPAKSQALNRRRLSGAIWAYPRPVEEKIDPENRQDMLLLKEGYVLKKGDGLFSVARKLKLGNYHSAQILVAIWMRNIDKFIFGNINGIRAGVRVDLKDLEYYLSAIDLATARNILHSQTVEWKLIKNATAMEAERSDNFIPEIALPVEKLEGLTDLFEQVKGWQSTWESKDLEGHLDYYQTLKNERPSRVSKREFFSRHPKLETSSKILLFTEGVSRVFFKQGFSSDNLKTQGLNEQEWSRTQSVWKIREENFYEQPSQRLPKTSANQGDIKTSMNGEMAINLSFVIHVSSHANESSAVSLVNQLRENGFDAYWAPIKILDVMQIYRVYVGRFADWHQAQRGVKALKNNSFGGLATAIPYPYALQVGEEATLADARALLESLRKSRFSGLLLVSYREPVGVYFRVVVGAYKKEGNATWMFQKLKQSGFEGKLISP